MGYEKYFSYSVVKKLIMDETELPYSPWKVLGFWQCMLILIVIYLRPWYSQRAAVQSTKNSIIKRLDKLKDRDNESSYIS
jgi:hypothetical protein